MKKLWSLAALSLPLVLVVGCGSDDSTGPTPVTSAEDGTGAERHEATTDNTVVNVPADGTSAPSLPGNATGSRGNGSSGGGTKGAGKPQTRE